MRPANLSVTLVALVLHSPAFANVDPRPPVNEKTIVGVWEAIDEVSVFRLEISDKGDSYLCQACFGGSVSLDRLERMTVKDGNVFLVLKSITYPEKTIRTSDGLNSEVTHIKGKGVASREEMGDESFEVGSLDVDLVMEPGTKAETVTKLRFVKLTRPSYIGSLHEQAQAAKKAIEQERKGGRGN